MKKQFSGIIGLFAIAFLIGAALTLSFATPVAACQQNPCNDFPQSCNDGSPCPGEPCIRHWDGDYGSPGQCCGTILSYFCNP